MSVGARAKEIRLRMPSRYRRHLLALLLYTANEAKKEKMTTKETGFEKFSSLGLPEESIILLLQRCGLLTARVSTSIII